jgi:DNA-directed RNA polymerase subunit RPC12/RpoP
LAEVKPKLVNALRELVRQYREEGIAARRHEIRRIRQARLFWQGLQYAWWNPNDMNWHLPFEQKFSDDRALEEMPRYQFVTNFYQGFGLSFIAVLSQDVPSVRFYPQSAQSLEDISAARAASDVAELIEQNNHIEQLLTSIGYFLWTDGKLGAYVRYVADGQRFGFHDEERLEGVEIPLGRDVYVCTRCGRETADGVSDDLDLDDYSEKPCSPANADLIDKKSPSSNSEGGASSAANVARVCSGCGAELQEKDLRRAERVAVPRVVGSRRVANGQEVISIAGGLELNTPVWANEMHEYPYLQWQAEVHRAKLKAAYPHAAAKIETCPAQGAEDVYARVSRLSVEQGLPSIHPGDALMNLITFDRTWLRPWAFYGIEDLEVRGGLLELFPDGCYVAFAGEAYCEARNESMDDHWRVLHALPGDGQNRPSVGDSLVQVQERYNVLSNMQAETYEYGIPPIYADPQVLDFDALANQVAEPAAHFPARARPGQPLSAGFFQPAAAQVPADMLRHQQDLIGPVSQFLTGLFPAVFGGNMEDVKTASGYALARDQAMGRLGLVWRRTKQFYADVILLAVDCFRKNRPEDAEIPLLGPDGVFDSHVIRIADLKGNICVHPEADETFPRLKSQQRGVIQQLFAVNDPVIQKALTEPANMGYIKNVLGLAELVIPGEDSRNKQLREIQKLLTGAPMVVSVHASGSVHVEPAVAADGSPASGIPNTTAIPLVLPSVPVDELLDEHAVEFEECKRWANSEAGQAAHLTNPAGFANVRAHAEAHLRAIKAQPVGAAV